MSCSEATDAPSSSPGFLDRRVAVSNIVSGAIFLGVLAFISWPLAVVGSAYVAAASLFLAAASGRTSRTQRQEVTAWVAPWLVAVAVWSWIGAGIEGGASASWPLALWFGVVIATPCYLGWQAAALAVRLLLPSGVRSAPA